MHKLIVFLSLLFSINLIAQDTIVYPKLSVISLDKVKVVYRGVDNPITVAVPNAKSYKVSGNGVSLQDDGSYIIKPGLSLETKVYIEIILEDDSVVVEEHVYQIKGLPNPTGTLNNEYSSNGDALIFTLDELKDAKIGITLIDFLFKLNLEVTQYTIKVPRNKALTIEGNIINDVVLNLLNKARRKDYIVISQMRGNYIGTHQTPKPITPIVFQIKK
jgi:hypothetical protein